MLQEIIVNLQRENNITICICDHIASSLLQITDSAMILSNGRIVAEGSPRELVNPEVNAVPNIDYEAAALNLKGQEWVDFINSLTNEQKIKLSQCWD